MPSHELVVERDGSHAKQGAGWHLDAVAAAGAGAWSWDATTQRVEWAPGLAPLGATPSTLDGLDDLVHPDDRAARGSS